MANTTMTRQGMRAPSPARWQGALRRALAAGVQVRQIGSTGQWIATSATDPTAAYELAIVNGVAHGCTCQAGQHGDPVCCHRARWWFAAGLLSLEADPAAPLPAPTCAGCGRRGTALQDKPLPAVIHCPACRDKARGGQIECPAARVPAAGDLGDLAQLAA